MVTCVELCAGGGGASLGLHAANIISTGFDNDPKAVRTARLNALDTHLLDIFDPEAEAKIRAHQPNPDLVWASSPCTGFSLASAASSARKDVHNSVTTRVAELLTALAPKVFIVENVLCARRHPTFIAAMETLTGSYSTAWIFLDAAKMPISVPQRRRRLFVIGVRTDAGKLDETNNALNELVEDARKMMRSNHETTIESAIPQLKDRSVFVYPRHSTCGCVFHASGVCPTLRSVCLAHPSRSIRARDDGVVSRAVKLTPDLAARICGFPPSFMFLNERVATSLVLGNCVCPPVAHWVAQRALRLLPLAGDGGVVGRAHVPTYRIKPVRAISLA